MSRNERRRPQGRDSGTPAPRENVAASSESNSPAVAEVVGNPAGSIPAPGSAREHPLDLLVTFICILVVTLTIGFVCIKVMPQFFVSPNAVGANAPNHERSMFTAVNAVTGTGFAQTWRVASEYSSQGLLLLDLLSLVGAGVTMTGGGMLLARAVGFDVRWRDLLAVTFGTFALGLLAIPGYPGVGLTFSGLGVFDAFSVVSGSGLSDFRTPYTLAQPSLHAIALPLFVVAGLGPVLLIAILRLLRQKPIPAVLTHCVMWITVTYIASTLLLSLLLNSQFVTVAEKGFHLHAEGLAAASAQAINARGLGLPIEKFSALPNNAIWTMMLLMLQGLGPASAAGGLSALPIVILLDAGHRLVRGKPVSRLVGVAIAWVAIEAAVIGFALLLLLSFNSEVTPDRMLFIVISAVCNVGLSHDALSISGIGSYALSIAMLTGKILPLAMLAWMARLAEKEQKAVS